MEEEEKVCSQNDTIPTN